MAGSAPQPEIIDKISQGVYLASAMRAGVQLNLFTPLKDGPLRAEQIAEAIGGDVFRLRPLLYALVIVGLLSVEGDLFANTAEADYFLIQGRPGYMGERLEFFFDLWDAALKTAETIRTGRPQAKHDFSTMPQGELEVFLRGLHWGAIRAGQELAAKYDFFSCRTVLDVGGGSGGLAIAMAEAYPHLQAIVVDLPTVTPITQRIVTEAGATDRVRIITADVVRQPLTEAFDVAVLKAFINVLSFEQARQALRNISQALNPGGTIYITGGLVLDNSRLSPPDLVTFNLVVLNLYESAQLYTEQEHKELLTEAGFEDIQRVPDMGFVARKPM